MTETIQPTGAAGAAREPLVDSRYPSLKREALGQLKLSWRLAHEDDDWSKGGRISDGFDRWTFWPYMAKFTYDLTYAIRMLAKMAEQTPAWREVYVDAGERLNHRMTQYAAWYDWVEQKGLDPNRASYPYFYYRHTMPPGMAGVYNAPGYCGNGLQTYMDGLFQSLMVAPVTPNPVHPYVHQHSPGSGGRVYDPDPVYANGSSNMMYRGYFLEQLAHMRRISGDTKYDDPLELVYDENISYRYSAEEIAAGLCEQFRAPMDANGSSLRFGIDCEVGKVFPICVTVAAEDNDLVGVDHHVLPLLKTASGIGRPTVRALRRAARTCRNRSGTARGADCRTTRPRRGGRRRCGSRCGGRRSRGGLAEPAIWLSGSQLALYVAIRN